MDSREVLEDALEEYEGTILAISHDRYFINRFANRVFVLGENGITEYAGDFDDYVLKRDQPRPPIETGEGAPTKTAQVRQQKRDRQAAARERELKAEVAKAESAIEDSERRVAELEAKLSDPATYADADRMLAAQTAYREEQQRQSDLYDALEQAEEALRVYQAQL